MQASSALYFEERECAGVRLWHLPAWTEAGVRHGFIGAGLDFSDATESAETVWQRWGCFSEQLRLLRQVHRVELVRVEPASDRGELERRPEADAWLVSLDYQAKQLAAFGIKTADCIPVVCLERSAGLAAIAHCGWRGTVAGLLSRTIESLQSTGASADRIEVAFGPGAQVGSYEVSRAVAQEFAEAEKALMPGCEIHPENPDSASSVELRGGQFFANLPQLLRLQAQVRGVPDDKIVSSEICTISDPAFFSYRRQKALSGRQLSFVLGNLA